MLLLLVSGTPPPELDPLNLLLRLPDEFAFWKRCLLEEELDAAEAADVAFLEAGPLFTPGLRPVCCFLVDPDPDELVTPPLLFFDFPWPLIEELEVELEPELELEHLLLPVLLIVSLRPSWLLGFTMYSVDAPARVLPPAESKLQPLVAKQLLGGTAPGCCGSIVAVPAGAVVAGVAGVAAAVGAVAAAAAAPGPCRVATTDVGGANCPADVAATAVVVVAAAAGIVVAKAAVDVIKLT